jgi:hypothetical protein
MVLEIRILGLLIAKSQAVEKSSLEGSKVTILYSLTNRTKKD